MKLLTKAEEDAHYSAVLKNGTVGCVAGLAAGAAAVLFASKRYHTIRNLTLPMKAFLVTSTGTFVGIIAADRGSRDFEKQNNAERMWYDDREQRLRMEKSKGLSVTDRVVAFARREKYKIVGATWVASMIGSFVLVSRNPFLSGQQKLVQARVYAQGLTLGVLCASAAFEISDQRRGRGMLDSKKGDQVAQQAEVAESVPAQHDPKEEGDLWKEMVAAEEQRLKSKHQALIVKSEHEATERNNGDNAKAEEPKQDENATGQPKEESESEEIKTETKGEAKDEGEKKA
ncbi:hypothetical protein N7451_012697 [Penicillium sp. IBT 35674x]|nr:hypothetical protein N7451_012697 [Penicillium sp. IBT 35674x]